jgi:hypothetical protein
MKARSRLSGFRSHVKKIPQQQDRLPVSWNLPKDVEDALNKPELKIVGKETWSDNQTVYILSFNQTYQAWSWIIMPWKFPAR